MQLNPAYSIDECRANGGHFAVGAGYGHCHRCGISLSGPGLHERMRRTITDPTRIVSTDPEKNVEWVGPDLDRAQLVARPDQVPDPLSRLGGKHA